MEIERECAETIMKSALRKGIEDWQDYYNYLSNVDYSTWFEDIHVDKKLCTLSLEKRDCCNCCLDNSPYYCCHERLEVEKSMSSGDKDKILGAVSSLIDRMKNELAKLENRRNE